jgi:RNA polymerase sigma factor (sigma-70 family)
LPSVQSSSHPEYLRILMAKIAIGDFDAFTCVYKETSSKLFASALRILHKHELAEEVLQESFVAVWRSASDYQSSLSAPMTWMTTIVRNKAFDLLRGTTWHLEIDNENCDQSIITSLIDPGITPPEALEVSRLACKLENCMAQLDEAHRQVVHMAFYDDMPHSEIAVKLNLPIGTVKTWIRRSRERLGTCLNKHMTLG